MLEFMAMILLPAVPEGTKEWRSGRKSGERGVKMVTKLQGYKVTRLQGYKVEPETAEPEFERVPSRSLLIMARLGEWNECQLPALCNVLTLQRF
jgi:2-polyprenyl-3-methyl-5-hydroxy-6-metoxy-1,4-benzoquinol methylase